MDRKAAVSSIMLNMVESEGKGNQAQSAILDAKNYAQQTVAKLLNASKLLAEGLKALGEAEHEEFERSKTASRVALNKFNAPELLSQLMAVLKENGLNDAVSALKRVSPVINEAWQNRSRTSSVRVAGDENPLATLDPGGKAKLVAALSRALPDPTAARKLAALVQAEVINQVGDGTFGDATYLPKGGIEVYSLEDGSEVHLPKAVVVSFEGGLDPEALGRSVQGDILDVEGVGGFLQDPGVQLALRTVLAEVLRDLASAESPHDAVKDSVLAWAEDQLDGGAFPVVAVLDKTTSGVASDLTYHVSMLYLLHLEALWKGPERAEQNFPNDTSTRY